MTTGELSDPVLGAPTARSPWSATLSWTPEQNGGRVGTSEARIPLGVLWDRLRGGETVDELARDFGLQVSAVHVVDQLRRELDDRALDAPCRDAEGECVNEREAADAWAEVPDRLKNGIRLSEAVRMLAGGRPAGADLVRAEDVSGVRVEAGPSSPLVSPGPRRRLAWSLFFEGGGVGSIVTDLDTEEWAAGSAGTEEEARAIARRRLDDSPSGGKGGVLGQDADLVEACRAAVLRPGDVPSHLAAAVLDELTRARAVRAWEEAR